MLNSYVCLVAATFNSKDTELSSQKVLLDSIVPRPYLCKLIIWKNKVYSSDLQKAQALVLNMLPWAFWQVYDGVEVGDC